MGVGQRRPLRSEILIITGLSGSGKTHVSRTLEDAGWFCVDNLPLAMIPRLAEFIRESPELRRCALVVDVREHDFVRCFPQVYRRIRSKDFGASLLFLEAEDKILLRRFSETRRPHPFGGRNQPPSEAIREEREALRPIRKMADAIVDTSQYTIHQLRDYVREHYELHSLDVPLVVTLTSFGYRFGVPVEADLVFDVRFLPNPNFTPALKKLTGQHAQVRRFMFRQAETRPFLRKLLAFLKYVVPRYAREGKSYLTIAIGCTGGRHRSVMVATWLGKALGDIGYPVKLRHRDLHQN